MKAEGGETSATLQPFFTLQLDIQHEMVGSVEEALLQVSEKNIFFTSPSLVSAKKNNEPTRYAVPKKLDLIRGRFLCDTEHWGCQ